MRLAESCQPWMALRQGCHSSLFDPIFSVTRVNGFRFAIAGFVRSQIIIELHLLLVVAVISIEPETSSLLSIP